MVPVITTTVLPTSVTKTAPAPELKTSAASDQLQSTSVTTTEDGSSNSNSTETVVDNKAASSKNSSAATFLGHDDEEEDAVSFIQAALRAHDLRSRSGLLCIVLHIQIIGVLLKYALLVTTSFMLQDPEWSSRPL